MHDPDHAVVRASRRGFGILLTAAVVVLIGCGPAGAKDLRFSHILSPTDPMHKAAEMIGAVLKDKTKGELDLKIYPNSTLGGERQSIEGLMLGTLDMANVSANIVSGYVPLSGITALPYLLPSFKDAFAVEDGPIGEEIGRQILAKIGVRVIGYTTTGFRIVATASKPVTTPAEFKGLKIRVPESPLMVATFKALGANPTPIPWGEIYTSLQSGVVDAVESPPATLNDAHIFEIAKAASLTNHTYTGQYVLMSEKVFQGLTKEQQRAVLEAGRQSTAWERQEAEKQQTASIDKIQKESEVKVYPVDVAPLQRAVANVYSDYGKTIGGTKYIDEILKMEGH